MCCFPDFSYRRTVRGGGKGGLGRAGGSHRTSTEAHPHHRDGMLKISLYFANEGMRQGVQVPAAQGLQGSGLCAAPKPRLSPPLSPTEHWHRAVRKGTHPIAQPVDAACPHWLAACWNVGCSRKQNQDPALDSWH